MSTSTPSSHRPASSTISVSVGAGRDQQENELRRRNTIGAYAITDLAEIFNISRPIVYGILTRAVWNPDRTSGQLWDYWADQQRQRPTPRTTLNYSQSYSGQADLTQGRDREEPGGASTSVNAQQRPPGPDSAPGVRLW